MHHNLLLTFQEITGLPELEIRSNCARIYCMEDQQILEYYMHYRCFPTLSEAGLIKAIGLANYNSLRINGIDVQ